MSEKKQTTIPEARSMSNDEYQRFKDAGMEPVYYTEDKLNRYGQSLVESREWVIENIYGGNFSGDVSRGELMRVAQKTIAITNGFEEEIKNS